jgi:DNA-directed RNA polymerase subunit RPC12/RpoP
VSEFTSFFRRCPACGHRFEIRLERKERIAEEMTTTSIPLAEERSAENLVGGPFISPEEPLLVGEGPPIMVRVEEFQYSYRCKHCGHEWHEKKETIHREPVDQTR